MEPDRRPGVPVADEQAPDFQAPRSFRNAKSSSRDGIRQQYQLLADTLVELRFIDGLGYETVRRTLKKTA